MRGCSPIALVFTLALVSVICACEKRPTGPANNTDAGTARDAAPLLIGVVGSITGIEATMGVSMQRGVQMALAEANAEGGALLADGTRRKVDARVYDSQGRPEEAARVATRLITQDKVTLVIGEISSSASLAMAPIVHEAKVPMISPSATNVRVTEASDFVFRVCFIDSFQGKVVARFASETLKLKKIAILKDNKTDYSLGLAEVFGKAWSEMGNTIVAEEAYSRGDTDFRSQLTAIKAKQPDAIYIPGGYTDVGVIARQAREVGITVPLLGNDGWDSEKLFELAGSAIDGGYFSNHYTPDDPSPRLQAFIAQYKAKFGAAPDAFAALSYDATKVGLAALSRAKDLSGPAIRDEIAKTQGHEGVTGNITLDDKRNATKPAVILQVKDGKARFIASVGPT